MKMVVTKINGAKVTINYLYRITIKSGMVLIEGYDTIEEDGKTVSIQTEVFERLKFISTIEGWEE